MSRFTIIGENIHATRVLRLNGKRVGLNEDGIESVIYYQNGNKSFMTIPDDIKKTQPYKQNQAKHFMIAIWKGIFGNSSEIEDGEKYVINEINRYSFGVIYEYCFWSIIYFSKNWCKLFSTLLIHINAILNYCNFTITLS